MDSIADIEKKQTILRELGKRHQIPTKWHNWKESFIEGIFSRGDIRCADLLELAFDKGCRLDSWDDQLKWTTWLEAIAEWGIDPQIYLGTLPVTARLPWDHIDVGLEDGFLSQEWKRATKNRLSPPCGKPKGMQVHHTNVADAAADQRKLVCYHCGIACDLTAMRNDRIEYLDKLGAQTRDDLKTEGFVPAYQQIRRDSIGRSLPPNRGLIDAAYRYRVIFTKLGSIAMTGHLDLARNLPRIIRRAGFTQKYSSGFSPRALISFGPALPLGVASLAEVCDFYLHDDLTPSALLERLSAVTDPGLLFIDACRIPDSAVSISKLARAAEYLVHLPGLPPSELFAGVARLKDASPIMVSAVRKNGPRDIDIRDGLIGLTCDLPRSAEHELLGMPLTPVLRWRVDLLAGPHVRSSDLATGLFAKHPEALASMQVARVGLFGFTDEAGHFGLLEGPAVAGRESADNGDQAEDAFEGAPGPTGPTGPTGPAHTDSANYA
jgi:radical SAM-linked protein